MVLMQNDLLRPKMESPTYPPYHRGYFLEEFFFHRWNAEQISATRNYIDVFWTNVFCNCMFAGKPYHSVQEDLNKTLNPSGKYFTVSQFDDGPFEEMPEDTIIFSAGGNRTKGNIIPIPLICSPIPQELVPHSKKILLASFVGSVDTHPIRKEMCASLEGKPDVELSALPWSVNVSMQKVVNFVETTCSSKFGLAPRGYGKSSFRLYEILQLGSVPVYISDEHYLPWTDELTWSDFSILVKPGQISGLYDLLAGISEGEYNRLVENGRRVYESYFTLEGMFQNIVKRIQADSPITGGL